MIPQFAQDVLAEVRLQWTNAIIAGGYVRDIVRERTPKDIDIFVPAYDGEPKEEVCEKLRPLARAFGLPEGSLMADFMAGNFEDYVSGKSRDTFSDRVSFVFNAPKLMIPVQIVGLRLKKQELFTWRRTVDTFSVHHSQFACSPDIGVQNTGQADKDHCDNTMTQTEYSAANESKSVLYNYRKKLLPKYPGVHIVFKPEGPKPRIF